MENLQEALYKEIFLQGVTSGKIQVTFSATDGTVAEVLAEQCYRALEKIKAVIHDDSLTDLQCFQKIEEIVCILEEIGSNGGTRHDFG